MDGLVNTYGTFVTKVCEMTYDKGTDGLIQGSAMDQARTGSSANWIWLRIQITMVNGRCIPLRWTETANYYEETVWRTRVDT